MDTRSCSNDKRDELFALKALAQTLQIQAKAAGRTLKRSEALETVARQLGFKDWNAAIAAAKADKLVEAVPKPEFLVPWEDVNRPLPRLPMRFVRAGDETYHSVRELMRWSKQLELIADRVPDDVRADLLNVVGGKVPYVFVRDAERFADELFHLCDRRYDEIAGIVFTPDQLEQTGVAAWQKKRGSHDGVTMFSVIDDAIRMHHPQPVELKLAARVLANIALMADRLHAEKLA